MITWELVKPDGSVTKVQPKNLKKFELKELQAHVGGYIELVRLKGNSEMYVNEDGLSLGLPLNEAASMICGGVIVGNALVKRVIRNTGVDKSGQIK